MIDSSSHAIFAEVRELAKAFEPVRTFAYIETKGFQVPRFRAEYFSVKSADEAVAMSIDTDAKYHSVSTVSLSLSFRRCLLACLHHLPIYSIEFNADYLRTLSPCLSSHMCLPATCVTSIGRSCVLEAEHILGGISGPSSIVK
jgi:hypothetical protein